MVLCSDAEFVTGLVFRSVTSARSTVAPIVNRPNLGLGDESTGDE